MILNHVRYIYNEYLDKYNTVPLSTNEYINASFVKIPNDKRFIATQGPIDTSIEDFWQMVFDFKVEMIVMLCSLTEGGSTKCAHYWNEDLKMKFKVKVLEEKEYNKYLIIRKFNVTNSNAESRTVNQLHFTGWPDHGAPQIEDVYETFSTMITKVNEYFNTPVIVHCSAGVGRTGTFISMYSLYYEILEQFDKKKTTIEFNVFNLVRKLKERRLFLVENRYQYLFLYGFIYKLLEESFKKIPDKGLKKFDIVLGFDFMRKFNYTIFDYNKHQIGFYSDNIEIASPRMKNKIKVLYIVIIIITLINCIFTIKNKDI